MQALLKAFCRRRTALGFGVHSPFAFRFITEVLRPPRHYAYYAYERIGNDSIARLAVRLLAAFNPSAVAFEVSEKARLKALRNIVDMVVPQAHTGNKNPEMLFIDTDTGIVDLSGREPCHMLIFGPNAMDTAASIARTKGKMIFTNDKDIAVVAALPHLPFTTYHLSL